MRALAVFVALLGSVAHAQYTNMLTGANYASPYAANAAFFATQMQQNAYFQTQLHKATQPGPVAPAAKKEAPPTFKFALSATDFTPTGPRNTAEQLASAGKTKEERAQLLELCRGIQKAIESQPGVRKNNISTALTVLLGISMQVVTEREFTDAESVGLQRLINDALAESPQFKAMSAQKRTAAYDAFLLNGGLIGGMAQAAKESGDAEQLELAKTLAKQSLALFLK